jgi:hypothetical protein
MTDDADTNADTAAANHSAADPFTVALALCQIAERAKTIGPAVKKLRKLGRDILAAERKLAKLNAEVAQTEAKFVERQAALDAREAALDARATEFESSLQEARNNLAAYYDSIVEADRLIRYRLLNAADLLGGFNPQLQDLPTWDQLRRVVANLPPDPPPIEREIVPQPRIDAFSDTFSDPHADRHGAPFLGTLSRDVSHKQRDAA